MAKTKFEIGDRVKVVKLIKDTEGYGQNRFQGYTTEQIPLNSKEVVQQTAHPSWQRHLVLPIRHGITYHVKINQKIYYLVEGELEHDKIESEDIDAGKLVTLINEKEPKIEAERNEFVPKFNPREEFAVWVREQFPQLKEHRTTLPRYDRLMDRSEEVMRAAEKAYNHALKNTRTCVALHFRDLYSCLAYCSHSPNHFLLYLSHFVDFIEKVSANLESKGDKASSLEATWIARKE